MTKICNALTRQTFEQIISLALQDNLCVQAWLGYAETLFLGFGNTIMPHTPFGQSHPHPPFELHTHCADWVIRSAQGVIGTNENERRQAEEAANQLVGRRIVGWHFPEALTNLTVHFEGDFMLSLTGPSISALSPEDRDEDAWTCTTAQGKYYTISCSGELAITD